MRKIKYEEFYINIARILGTMPLNWKEERKLSIELALRIVARDVSFFKNNLRTPIVNVSKRRRKKTKT